jgi:chemotaxis protein methyltransferase CheR
MWAMPPITDAEFGRFQRFIYDHAGITLPATKKSLVSGRLASRVATLGCPSLGAYFALLSDPSAADELQTAVDLLTTNETYFFREPRHFELLREIGARAAARREPLRAWSAACSSGEEPYSIAMVLADCMGSVPFEVIGSDISRRMLERARAGHYAMERARQVPPGYLKRFCRRGTGPHEGTLLVERSLRERVRFAPVNLNAALPRLGSFDVIFLRNVLIYFSAETKRQVVERIVAALKPAGTLVIGHSESLNGVTDAVVASAPSIYRRAG